MTGDLTGALLGNRYRVVRRLGSGGMAVVYEALDESIHKRVAVKLLLPEHARNGEVVERFRREALSAARIRHPHVVDVTGFERLEDGTAFMVLELLEGRDWQETLEATPKPPIAEIASILSQVCEALAAAHALGVVHRDLKPSNVFLIERDQNPRYVKVLDFGISKLSNADPLGDKALTKTQTPLGTPLYMSPEQAQGRSKDANAQTDLWAVGAMLYEALCGRPPFDADSSVAVVAKILLEEPRPIASLRPEAPAELIALCGQLLRKAQDERPSDALLVKQALAAFTSLREPSAGPQPPTDPFAATVVSVPPGRELPTAQPSAHEKSLPLPSIPVRGQRLVIFALAAAVATGALLFALAQRQSQLLPLHQAPAPSGAVAQSQPRAQSVSLTISTKPADAEVSLGGERLHNPFAGTRPRTEQAQWLVVRREGYLTHQEQVRLNENQRFEIALERLPSNVAAPVARPEARRKRTQAEPSLEPQTTPTAPVAAPPPADDSKAARPSDELLPMDL